MDEQRDHRVYNGAPPKTIDITAAGDPCTEGKQDTERTDRAGDACDKRPPHARRRESPRRAVQRQHPKRREHCGDEIRDTDERKALYRPLTGSLMPICPLCSSTP